MACASTHRANSACGCADVWLLLEAGNSRIKWAQWGAAGYAGRGALALDAPGLDADLHGALAAMPVPGRVLLASVAPAPATAGVRAAVRAVWGREPECLAPRARQHGVINAYADPAQMGVDRWLALIAARHHWPVPVCVVDAGTAVTVDVLDGDGVHRGGLIAPGTDLWRAGLQARTAGIRAAAREPAAVLGRSTAECVANGGLLAVIGLVGFALQLMQGTGRADGVLVVTGGGGAALAPHLPATAQLAPDLVFDGMRFAVEDDLP